MPTKHERIAVVRDEALDDALWHLSRLTDPSVKVATLVHDLAVEAAWARIEIERRKPEAIERFIALTTNPDAPLISVADADLIDEE